MDLKIRKKSLSYSIREGCCHSVMVGAGETYLAPFAIFLGSSPLIIGWLASLPLFLGSLAQMAAVYLLDRIHSRKLFNFWPSLIQAFSLILIFFLPFLFNEQKAPFWLLAAAIPYFTFGTMVGPSWNSWVGDLVPPAERGTFFGRRNRYKTIFQMLATLVAGGILSTCTKNHSEWLGYGIVLGMAALARSLSAWYHFKTYEPPFTPPTQEQAFTFREFLNKAPFNNFGRFTIYAALVMVAASISGPFFTVYFLSDLKLSYFQFTLSSAVFVFFQALAFYPWGKIGDRYGNRLVLYLSGFLLPTLPVIWMISPRFEFILFVQSLAGIVWAAFYAATANFIFDSVTPAKRPRCFAYYTVFSNLGIFIGATLGGVIVPYLPEQISFWGFSWEPFSSLYFLFLISAVLRLIFALIFIPMIHEVKEVRPHSWSNILFLIEEFIPWKR